MRKNILVKILVLSFAILLVSPLSLRAAGITALKVGETNAVEEGEVKSESGSGWSYSNNTLTLNGYNGGTIVATGDLTIQLRGVNAIKTETLVSGSKAISVNGSLVIRGIKSDYSDTLNISGYAYGILTVNDMSSEFTSVDVSQATLNFSNTNFGIYANNTNADSDNVKNKVILGNSAVSVSSNNAAIVLIGSDTSNVNYTRLVESAEQKSSSNDSGKKVVAFYNGTSLAKILNMYPGYKITYNLTLMSLTNGSSLNYLTGSNNFSCGFNVENADYALPTKIVVKVNGVELTADKYTYNSATGNVVISKDNINGDIEIIAAAEPCDPNPQTGTLDIVVKLGLSIGLVGVIVLAKSLKLI